MLRGAFYPVWGVREPFLAGTTPSLVPPSVDYEPEVLIQHKEVLS